MDGCDCQRFEIDGREGGGHRSLDSNSQCLNIESHTNQILSHSVLGACLSGTERVCQQGLLGHSSLRSQLLFRIGYLSRGVGLFISISRIHSLATCSLSYPSFLHSSRLSVLSYFPIVLHHTYILALPSSATSRVRILSWRAKNWYHFF